MINTVRNTVRNTIRQTVRLGANLKQAIAYFARLFNEVTKYIQIGTDWFVKDTESTHDSTRVTEPTIVLLGDGTASMQITEADYPTVDFGVAVFSYVTEDNTGATVTGTSSAGTFTIVIPSVNFSNLKMWGAGGSPSQVDMVDLNLTGTQAGVTAQWLCDEGAGEGTNVVLFDRLSGNTATLVSATLPDVWSTSLTIPSVQEQLGWNVSDGTELSGALEEDVRIPINPTTPTQDILGNTPTYTGIASRPLVPVKRNCVKTTNTEYLQASTNLIDGNKWAFEIDLMDVDVTNTGNMIAGKYNNSTPFIGIKDTANSVFRIRNNSSVIVTGTYDTSQLVNGILLIVSNATTVAFYIDKILVDTLTIDATLSINKLLNYGSFFASGLGYKGKANNAKIWNLSAYSQAEIDALDFSTLAPTYWFPLEDYPAGTSPTGAVVFHDKMNTGVTLTLTNGTLPDNLSSCDGKSDLAENGFNKVLQFNGIDNKLRLTRSFATYNNAEIEFDIQTLDTQGSLFSYSLNGIGLILEDGGSGSAILSLTSVEIDGVLTTTNRDGLHTLLADGLSHHVKIVVDLSAVPYIEFMVYGTAFYTEGSITNITIDLNSNGTLDHSYLGYGDTPWTDLIGGVDLVLSGTALSTKHIPASETDTGNDIAGVPLVYEAGNTQDAVQQYQMIPSQANIAIDANNVFFDATPEAKDVSMNDIESNDYIEVTKDSDSNVTDLKILE